MIDAELVPRRGHRVALKLQSPADPIATFAHLSAVHALKMIQLILKELHYSPTLHVTDQQTTPLTFAAWSNCYSAPVILHSRWAEKIDGQENALDMDMDMARDAMQCLG